MNHSTKTKTPTGDKFLIAGLWGVASYLILMATGNIAGHVLRFSGYLYLSSEQEIYLHDTSFIMAIIAGLVMAMNFFSGILLFQRRRAALYILAVSTTINIVSMLSIVKTSGVPLHIHPGMLFFLYGLRLSVLGFVYLLYRKNILSH